MKSTTTKTKLQSKPAPSPEPTFKRRILLCVTGLTPQVVTESIYALARRTPPFAPTEVHIITTAEGENRAWLDLLDERRGQLGKLCQQHKLPLPLCDKSTIHVIQQSGQALADMRSAQENDAAADTILDVVRRLTADAECQIHFSIAGGRKTMGFYLGYCASLLGRPQDEMSHVLVNPPFENLPAFFFPPDPPEVIHDRKVIRVRKNKPHDTGDSSVDLAPVAFLRLRGSLPADLQKIGRSFSETVRRLNALQGKPELTLRLVPPKSAGDVAAYQMLVTGGNEVKLSPKNFALLWMFARIAMSPNAAERTVEDSAWQPLYKSIALGVYGVASDKGQRWDKEVSKFSKPVESSDLRNQVDKLNKQLRESLWPNADKVYGITVLKHRTHSRYGMSLPASAIVLEDARRLVP